MTLNYGIFDSADPLSPDRTYTAALLSRIVSKYLDNGIITGDLNEMTVTVSDPPGMSIIVATGTAMVQGRFCENDAALTMTISTAHSTYARIDRVVVRLSAVSGRTIDIVVIAGTPAASPVAPALTQTSGIWEIPLAQIAVGAGVTSILTANITDQRVFPDMTNLFKAAVEMQSDLDIGGDVSVAGDMHVTGAATYGGSVAFAGGVVADLTGDISGNIKRNIIIGTAPGIFTLGDLIPANSYSSSGNISGDIATGIVARTSQFASVNPAFCIFGNLGYGSNIPYIVVLAYHVDGYVGKFYWSATTKRTDGTIIQTYSGTGTQQHANVPVTVTSDTDKISYTLSCDYGASKSISIAAYSASFD